MWIISVLNIFLALGAIGVGTNTDGKSVSSAISKFSSKFSNELATNKSVVSSPLSAEFALGLLALGTTDPAHSELLTSLGFADDDSIRSSFAAVLSTLRSIKGVTLNVANKVYIKEGSYDLHPQFQEDAVKVFDAAMEKVDFSDSAAAVNNINTWVESKTNHKIKDLLSSDSVDGNTRLVLVNALYFKGKWKHQFDPKDTMDRAFHLSTKSNVQVPMMYKEDHYSFGYSEHLQAQILEIPYLGKEASMLIVLPQKKEGLNDVMAKLAAGHDLMSDVEKMSKTKVQVTIPKFKIETEIDLKPLLQNLSISAIFVSGQSRLTKLLNNDEALYVSQASQKAFIEVNEEGTEAAATTAIGVDSSSASMDIPPVEQFVADRPFLASISVDRTPYFIAVYRGDI